MSFGGPLLLAPLHTLLGIRPGMNVAIHQPPDGFFEALGALPEGCALVTSSSRGVDLTVLFTKRKVELIEKLPKLTHAMSVTGSLWVCYPTEALSAQAPSEDFVRLAALEMGLTDVKKLLLDPAWSGLKLQWKARAPRLEKPEARA